MLSVEQAAMAIVDLVVIARVVRHWGVEPLVASSHLPRLEAMFWCMGLGMGCVEVSHLLAGPWHMGLTIVSSSLEVAATRGSRLKGPCVTPT